MAAACGDGLRLAVAVGHLHTAHVVGVEVVRRLEIGIGMGTPVLAAPCTKDTKKHFFFAVLVKKLVHSA